MKLTTFVVAVKGTLNMCAGSTKSVANMYQNRIHRVTSQITFFIFTAILSALFWAYICAAWLLVGYHTC